MIGCTRCVPDRKLPEACCAARQSAARRRRNRLMPVAVRASISDPESIC
jgi:hypothetical protein